MQNDKKELFKIGTLVLIVKDIGTHRMCGLTGDVGTYEGLDLCGLHQVSFSDNNNFSTNILNDYSETTWSVLWDDVMEYNEINWCKTFLEFMDKHERKN